MHHVADAHAALGQDHETADVVGRELLQAETDADADRPPSTDSADRSMPTVVSAVIRPTNMNSARAALLAALRSDSSLPPAVRSRRDSIADEIQSASSSTAPGQRALDHGADRQACCRRSSG